MEERVRKIVDTLLRGTREDKVTWESTDRNNEFSVKLENGGVTVDRWTADDEFGDKHYLADIGFLNKQGELIDRIVINSEEDVRDYQTLADLHEAARRKHMRVDEKLDDLLEEIQKKVGSDDVPF